MRKAKEEMESIKNEVKNSGSLNSGSPARSFYDELNKIRQGSRSTAGEIRYKDIHDHKNISLYFTNGLRIGKRVGPLHPSNAEVAFNEFYKHGIILSLTKPTEEEIEEYKETDEYKALRGAFERDRSAKKRSRKESEIEKLTKTISQLVGTSPSKLNQIRSPEEVSMTK